MSRTLPAFCAAGEVENPLVTSFLAVRRPVSEHAPFNQQGCARSERRKRHRRYGSNLDYSVQLGSGV